MSTTKVDDYQLVEADPRLADVIRRTHELNGSRRSGDDSDCVATCDPALIGRGEVEFYVGAKFCASSLLGARNPKQTVTVPVISLPELIRENGSTC